MTTVQCSGTRPSRHVKLCLVSCSSLERPASLHLHAARRCPLCQDCSLVCLDCCPRHEPVLLAPPPCSLQPAGSEGRALCHRHQHQWRQQQQQQHDPAAVACGAGQQRQRRPRPRASLLLSLAGSPQPLPLGGCKQRGPLSQASQALRCRQARLSGPCHLMCCSMRTRSHCTLPALCLPRPSVTFTLRPSNPYSPLLTMLRRLKPSAAPLRMHTPTETRILVPLIVYASAGREGGGKRAAWPGVHLAPTDSMQHQALHANCPHSLTLSSPTFCRRGPRFCLSPTKPCSGVHRSAYPPIAHPHISCLGTQLFPAAAPIVLLHALPAPSVARPVKTRLGHPTRTTVMGKRRRASEVRGGGSMGGRGVKLRVRRHVLLGNFLKSHNRAGLSSSEVMPPSQHCNECPRSHGATSSSLCKLCRK